MYYLSERDLDNYCMWQDEQKYDNRQLVECHDGDAQTWLENERAASQRIADNRFSVVVPPKGIVALAIPATVKPRFQAKLYAADAPPLPEPSFEELKTPFGTIRAMLLTAGPGLTSAFVYADTPPEDVIIALHRTG